MKICRNGDVFELTPDELYQAYEEQQHNYDLEDVESELNLIIEDDMDEEEFVAAAKRVIENNTKLNDCAYDYRRNMNKYGMDWSTARSEAVKDAVCAEMK